MQSDLVNKKINNGLIVKVHSPIADAEFRLLLDGKVLDAPSIIPNKDIVIPLEPYRKYSVGLVVESEHLFAFDDQAHSVILYPGNVAKIEWHAAPSVLMMVQLIDTENSPIIAAVVDEEDILASTDDYGWLQVNLKWQQGFNVEQQDGTKCYVAWPSNLQVYEQVIVLDEPLICKSESNTDTKMLYAQESAFNLHDELQKLSHYVLPEHTALTILPEAGYFSMADLNTLSVIANSILVHAEVVILEIKLLVGHSVEASPIIETIKNHLVAQGLDERLLRAKVEIVDAMQNLVEFNVLRVNFANGASYLDSKNIGILADQISYISRQHYKYLVVEGHTDARGGDAFNVNLSRKRALAVKNIMQMLLPNQIIYNTYRGAKELLHAGDHVQLADNRRVEIYLLKH